MDKQIKENIEDLFSEFPEDWLSRFKSYIDCLGIKHECPLLTPSAILNKLKNHVECDASQLSTLTVSDVLKLTACRCDITTNLQRPCKGFLLICKLIPLDTEPGKIGISDNSGRYIQCQITESLCESILCGLNKWSILASWNLIVTSEMKFLEITSPVLLLEEPVKKKICQAMSMENAAVLLDKKDLLEKKTVNFYGQVIVVSKIFRVKNDSLFWVKLKSSVNILIKRKEYLHWEKFLTPQKEYIFTNMRPTTLQKGVGDVVKVYVPWKDSSIDFYTPDKVQSLSLMDWLCSNDIPASIQEKVLSLSSSHVTQEIQFIYQGVITNSRHAAFGVYELDSKIRLYLPYTQLNILRMGSRIVIYNAHLKKSKQNSRIRIVCCMQSCFKVLNFPENVVSEGISTVPKDIQKNLWKFNCSMNNLIYIMDTLLVLRSKFSTYSLERFGDISSFVYENGNLQSISRNPLFEVQSSNHACCFVGTEKECSSEFLNICDVEISESDDKMNDIAMTRHDENKDWNQHLYWSYITEEGMDNKILVGELQISSKSGKIILKDRTGSIDCVVMETQADLDKFHICDARCCLCNQTTRSKFTCPHLHPYCNGCTVAVTKYFIVIERFLIGGFSDTQTKDDISKNMSNQLYKKYLVFSMTDVFMISRPKHGCCQNQEKPDNSEITSDQLDMEGQEFFVLRKESLRWADTNSDIGGFTFVLQTCECLHSEAKNILTERTNYSSQSQCNGSVCPTSYTDSDHNQGTCNKCQMFLLKNECVKYYNVLDRGGLYRFCGLEKMVSEKRKLPWQLKQCAKKAGNNMCHVMPDGVKIYRDFHTQIDEDKFNVDGIDDILSGSFCKDYVFIIGRIVRRVHLEPDDFKTLSKKIKMSGCGFTKDRNISTLDNWQIQLQVKCMKSDGEITVYLKLDKLAYPLGLLPGAVIYLQHIERRKSRKGVVYCQYSVVSSLTVLHYNGGLNDIKSHRAKDEDKPTSADLQETLPSAHLVDIWKDSALSDFSCFCFIQKVNKISLKCVCQMCGSVVTEGCSNPLCHCEEYRFVARMSITVDDGTSVAMVSCSDAVVQTLLMLSENEWEALKLEVKSQGEVFLQQKFPEFGTPLEKFIYVLYENQQIKRTVAMSLRSKPMSCNGKEPYLHPAELLKTMSVEDFVEKKVDTGLSVINTRCLPFLQLTCLRVTEMNYLKEVMYYNSVDQNLI